MFTETKLIHWKHDEILLCTSTKQIKIESKKANTLHSEIQTTLGNQNQDIIIEKNSLLEKKTFKLFKNNITV